MSNNNSTAHKAGAALGHLTIISILVGVVLALLKAFGATDLTWSQALMPLWLPAAAYGSLALVVVLASSFQVAIAKLVQQNPGTLKAIEAHGPHGSTL